MVDEITTVSERTKEVDPILKKLKSLKIVSFDFLMVCWCGSGDGGDAIDWIMDCIVVSDCADIDEPSG